MGKPGKNPGIGRVPLGDLDVDEELAAQELGGGDEGAAAEGRGSAEGA